jgi:hypothetical protein
MNVHTPSTLCSTAVTVAGKTGRAFMKITSVKTAASKGHCMHIWVRIETDAGVTGLGECVHGGHAALGIIGDLEP